MGLDTTHNCWHGSYSGFRTFRDAVAVAAKEHFDYTPNYQDHPSRAFMGWWDADHHYTHLLDVFFVHSDCEGYLFPNDIQELVPALEQLVGYLNDEPAFKGWPSTRGQLRQFIDGLNDALNEWEVVRFH